MAEPLNIMYLQPGYNAGTVSGENKRSFVGGFISRVGYRYVMLLRVGA
jgi:hypothetical protein